MTNPTLIGKITGYVTEFSAGGSVARQIPITDGSFSVNSDCLGGTFTFNGINGNDQFAFEVATPNQLYLAQDGDQLQPVVFSESRPRRTGPPVTGGGQSAPRSALIGGLDLEILAPYEATYGTASLLTGPPVCPAPPTSPTTLFGGTWAFQTHDFFEVNIGGYTAIPSTAPNGRQGTIANGITTGINAGNVTVGMPFGGTYQMYSDCSGGTLITIPGVLPIYEFVFAGPDKIYFVDTTSSQDLAHTGIAVKRSSIVTLTP